MKRQFNLATKQSIGLTRIAALAAVFAVAQASSALVITGTPDASWAANFGANTAAATATWNAAAAEYMAAFTDPIHINITMSAVSGTGTLGMSSSPIFSFGYGAIRNAFVGDITTADDNTFLGANGSFTAADPVGGNHNWWVTRAQGKAVGLIGDDLNGDGTTTFGTGFNYVFVGGNRATAGAIDFQGVCEHEISEIMGRIGISGGSVNGAPAYTVADLLSWTGPGARSLNNGPGSMSIDQGNTLLLAYNNAGMNGGDTRDWAGTTNDAFNAFSSSGVANPLSATDFREMDVLGYDQPVPEPAPIAAMGLGVALVGFARRRKA